MNYYEHHLGDYAKDTAHLTMLEHGAYRMLLDRYYSTEQGIPAEQAHRVARARTRDERAAVDAVLTEFFTLEDSIWRNRRADQEIAKFAARQPRTEERRENDRERQRRARERRKALFEALSAHDVHMAWNATTEALQDALATALSRAGGGAVTPPVTRDDTATQTPIPRPQAPGTSPGGAAGACTDTPAQTTGGAVYSRLKAAGISGANPSHPRLLALLAAGCSEDEFAHVGAEASARGKGFAWVLATVEGRRRDAANAVPLPALPPRGAGRLDLESRGDSRADSRLSSAGRQTVAAAQRWLEQGEQA